jgi:hypothetical protein
MIYLQPFSLPFVFWFVLIALPLASSQSNCVGINAVSPRCGSAEALYRRDFFYIGGRYVFSNSSFGNLFVDQLYVEKLTPSSGVRKTHPLVFFHGGGPSGTVCSLTAQSTRFDDRDCVLI